MDELITQGLNLIVCIEDTLTAYDMRSSIHEKLSWERVGVKGMVEQLKSNSSLTYDLKAIHLDKEWGTEMVATLPDLFTMAFEFRSAYENRQLNQ